MRTVAKPGPPLHLLEHLSYRMSNYVLLLMTAAAKSWGSCVIRDVGVTRPYYCSKQEIRKLKEVRMDIIGTVRIVFTMIRRYLLDSEVR